MNSEPVQWTLGALIFRTRFFPLRTIDNQLGVRIQHVVNSSTGNYVQYLLFSGCMLAVIFSIIVYLKRLHTMVNASKQPVYYPVKTNDIETYPLCDDESIQSERKNKNVFINMNFSWSMNDVDSTTPITSKVAHRLTIVIIVITPIVNCCTN